MTFDVFLYGVFLLILSINLMSFINILFIKFNKKLFWRLYRDDILSAFEDYYLQERWDKCD